MRDINNWYQEISKKLRDSDALKGCVSSISNLKIRQRELSRLVRLIVQVELGLTLLEQVAPEEPAASVAALLSGYRYAIPQFEEDTNWQLIQNARFYLVRVRGKQWERAAKEYIDLPQVLRVYSLDSIDSVPRLIPSSTAQNRSQTYRRTLNHSPKHKNWEFKLAGAGRWFCKVSKEGNNPVEVPVDIPSAVAAIASSSQKPSIRHFREGVRNPAVTVTFEELLQTAQEMDRKYSKRNWHGCLHNIELQLYDSESNDFLPGNVLRLEQLIHIVGLLNVGKSTLLEVLTYHFAKQGYRCALIVNDVVTAVRTASMFWHQLEIEAIPVLGQSNRADQLKKVHDTLFVTNSSGDITEGATHPALRWFSPVCPLLALVQSEEKWEYGQEPCHQLYQLKNQQLNQDDQDDDEDDDWDEKKYYTCPLYYKCPRHQLEKDIAAARIWVLTPASFIHTRVPRQVAKEKITFAEAIYRECHFLFVDEADRVQLQFDEAFAPSEVLVDATREAYLNKVGNCTSSIYQSARSEMAADRLVAWLSAQYFVQNATNRIYHQLLNKADLVEWLGSSPFTGRSLFAKIIREVTEPEESQPQHYRKQTRQQRIDALRQRTASPSAQQKKLQKLRRSLLNQSKLDKFLQNSINLDCELSILASHLLRPGDDKEALAKVKTWCCEWLKDHIEDFSKKIDLEELARNVHFAILITVLDTQLTYLVDHIPSIRTVLDLQDLNQKLLRRPPFDYLPIVPESPVGNILGFCYRDDDRNSRGGKLDYFRYVGVGRALLLRFPTLFAIDGWEGPHTILISGTSYAPGSPKNQDSLYYTPPSYHIDVEPTVLLQPKSNYSALTSSGISESRFVFSPLSGFGGIPISISGSHYSIRKQNVRDLIQTFCSPEAGGLNLDDVFQSIRKQAEANPEQWIDRERFLMVTGSYDEAEWSCSVMRPLCLDKHLEPLRRDQSPPNLQGIRRSRIQGIRETPVQGVFAPLLALERGYNILNKFDKAAFGAALFLNRPMPVPDDWQTIVQQLNAWALKHEDDSKLLESEPVTVIKAADAFYLHATNKLRELSNKAYSFHTLTEEERDVLCWNQLIKIWQIIGRLVRGNVPAEVYFLDAKFAPFSAEDLKDKANTSLLVAIIKTLELHVEGVGLEPWRLTLARSLYGDFLKALKNTEGLKYEN
jgi:hypothetical protein